MTAQSDVCVVGAGPAGLMLASLLARFGLATDVVDDRPDQTAVGRADGIQPKTIETFQMMGLGDALLRDGVRVHDICMWRGAGGVLQREGRSVHYPDDALDVLWPFVLLCHQGMIEGILLDDLRDSGVEVQRSQAFQAVQTAEHGLQVACASTTLSTKVLVGCDGARSKVRATIPDSYAQGTPHRSAWGVLDGELDTDFPDLWSKTVVFSEEHGTILIIPRERNMTRFYIELKASDADADADADADDAPADAKDLRAQSTQAAVMDKARKILAPYRLAWTTVEWFGHYTVAQRVANRFANDQQTVFIAGDASHTHSPKAAQGMNTSVHDAWNLAWKLNLAARGLARPCLLATYEAERKKIAHDLIAFDYEHANQIAGGDAAALAANFRTNIRFIAGVGVDYGLNELNLDAAQTGLAVPGTTLPPAKATRYIDANPVDVQMDVPVLGQFRVYVFGNVVATSAFLHGLSDAVLDPSSAMARLTAAAHASYAAKPRPVRAKDVYVRPARYTAVSELFTYCVVSTAPKAAFEIADLPALFRRSPWTVYVDDVPGLDTRQQTCTEKWVGGVADDEVAVLSVRPDGYVGCVRRWGGGAAAGRDAAQWLDTYYSSILNA